MRYGLIAAAALMSFGMGGTARAAVRITEFMYQGAGSADREFVELTNLTGVDEDVATWTYNDDNPNNPVAFGAFFGTLAARESVILTELTADAFRAYWSLDDRVRIFSIGASSNLGAADTINIYNGADQTAATLVDSVTYSGTMRGISRNRPDAAGPVTNAQFVNAAVGDVYGSASAGAAGTSDLGNPGRFAVAASAVPEPAGWMLMLAGFGLLGGAMRRRPAAAAAFRA